MSFQSDYAAYCAEYGEPDRIEVMMCDLNAVLRGKWLPGTQAAKVADGTVRLPQSTYAPNILGEEVEASGLGIAIGDPDGILVPIPGTLKPVPWGEGSSAQVLAEMVDENDAIISYSPRLLLQNMLGRFAAKGLYPVVATELEFYLFRERDRRRAAPVPPKHTPQAQNYDLEVLGHQEDILTDILNACEAQGLPTDTLIAEYGPGQFEINFLHTDDVPTAADTAVLFRRLVRGVTSGHELEATFMAKPYADQPGNGMHAHVSLLDADGNNVFDHDGDEANPMLQSAVAGVVDSMYDLQAIFAPHMNSYRRFQPLSFAPHAPEWGYDNRQAAVRLPAVNGPAARLEHRISGADVNPYLAITAILGGMLYGIENNLTPPAPLEDPAHKPAASLSHDWQTAQDRFATSDIAADVFGTEYRDIYTAVKRDEIQQLTTQITELEYRTYLSRL